MSKELTTYSFTQDDIDLITYALRKLSLSGGPLTKEAIDLIEYIEREKKDKGL